MAHARVAPSALAITVPCPASLTMQEQIPAPPDSDAALEGDVGHKVALTYGTFGPAMGRKLCPVGTVIKHAGRDWTVDDDMVDGALLYAENVHPAGRFEESVVISDLPECFGTPDFFKYDTKGGGADGTYPVFDIVDYKYGHRAVDPFENFQLMSYLLGVVEQLNKSPQRISEGTEVRFKIVQPRAYHREGPVREWKT